MHPYLTFPEFDPAERERLDELFGAYGQRPGPSSTCTSASA
jgi:hypothetical protein